MTALPVHCPSITSIQGPSVLSSEEEKNHYCQIFVLFLSNVKYLVSTHSATVCCTKGFLWTELLCLIFAAPQDIHNILLLRKSTTTFLWKHTLKFCKKNTKKPQDISRCLQNFFFGHPKCHFFVFSPIHSPNWQS